MPGESSSFNKWRLALLLIVIAAVVGSCSWKLGGPSATVGLLGLFGIGYFASRDGAGQGSVWVLSIYSLALLGWVLGAEAGWVLGVFITFGLLVPLLPRVLTTERPHPIPNRVLMWPYYFGWCAADATRGFIPNMVSEIIRWQTPLAHMRRTATQDAEIAGKRIKKGDGPFGCDRTSSKATRSFRCACTPGDGAPALEPPREPATTDPRRTSSALEAAGARGKA